VNLERKRRGFRVKSLKREEMGEGPEIGKLSVGGARVKRFKGAKTKRVEGKAHKQPGGQFGEVRTGRRD